MQLQTSYRCVLTTMVASVFESFSDLQNKSAYSRYHKRQLTRPSLLYGIGNYFPTLKNRVNTQYK